MQPAQHRCRQFLRCNNSLPSADIESSKSCFGERGSVGQAEKSPPASDGQCAEPAISYEIDQRRRLIKDKIDPFSEKLRNGRSTTAVRNVLKLDVRQVGEVLDREMLERPDSGRPIGQGGFL
jgi:hypothetical protein